MPKYTDKSWKKTVPFAKDLWNGAENYSKTHPALQQNPAHCYVAATIWSSLVSNGLAKLVKIVSTFSFINISNGLH